MSCLWRSMYSAPGSVLRRGMAERADDGSFNYVHPMSSLHMIRDGEATTLLSDIFACEFARTGTLLNLPPDVFGLPDGNSSELEGLGAPALAPPMHSDDLIIQATRFPLHDDPVFDTHAVIRSGSAVETQISDALLRLFRHCSRNAVILSDEVAANCTKDALEYRAVQFSMRSDERTGRISGFATRAGNTSQVHSLDRCRELSGSWSIGYLAFIPAIGSARSSPAFLNAFGLHGTGTLLWSMYVKESLSLLVLERVRAKKPWVMVCRFHPRFAGTNRPSHLSVPPDEKPEVLVDVTISEKPKRSAPAGA